ncbi:MAG: beta-ketoacyl-ACP synthase II [Chloroflexota bacterium]|nr:MAG: beta-ketoacyl-ACP synthase II [Chloroflexota bacterium]
MERKNGERRVVVTGLGMITPLGHNVTDTWDAILAGRSGLGEPTLLGDYDHRVSGVCEVKEFDPAESLGRRKARRRDRYEQLATVAANEAMAKADLQVTDQNRERIGVYMGTGIGGIMTLVQQEHVLQKSGLRRLSPFGITMIMPNGASGMLAIDYGINGPSPTITTACAAGNDAIGYAFKAIRAGELDAVLTGGSEAIMTSVAIGGFERAGAVSQRDGGTPRPFDVDRDGLVPGEGAGMLVLESLEHAQSRGATILAELAGYGQTTDGFHITAPSEGGLGAARAMTKALENAGVSPDEVDYVSAHGTGTQLNDSHETMSIKAALGEQAYDVAVSSTKSMTGHIMGATGAIEAAFCVLAVRYQIAPPTINYQTPDPECDLDYVPNAARPTEIKVALNNAFGFGGHNAVTVIKEFSE